MKKKVLILIPSIRRGGGAERAISNLSKKLNNFYDLHILTFNHFQDLYDYKSKYFTFNENQIPWKVLLRPFKIYNYIRRYQIDLIISVLDYTNFIAIITKLLFRIKIPLIINLQNNPKLEYKKQYKYYNYLIRLLYSLKVVDKLVPVSKEVQKILIKDYGINGMKIKSIYNSIDTEFVSKAKYEKIINYQNVFANNNLIKFITIGRLHQSKGQIYLLKAFIEVIKKIPNSKLIIIGEGPLECKLKQIIETYHLKDDVILMGKKENPFKYLYNSTVFVLSSIYEGLPLVLLEALACNLPIISSNCETGPKEILDNGKYGILTNVMDPEDLAQNMIILASNPVLLREFSEKSRERAKFFDMEKMNKKWVDLIESIIRK